MEDLLRRWILEIFQQHQPLLALAVRQRAKFEGWLKFELAQTALRHGARQVVVEAPYPAGTQRRFCDLAFTFHQHHYGVELKTANTNWRIPGVAKGHRPITKNLKGIIRDIEKLRVYPGTAIMAFALFPIPPGDERWQQYLQRIAQATHLPLSPERHCERFPLSLGDPFPEAPGIIVCTFAIQKEPLYQ